MMQATTDASQKLHRSQYFSDSVDRILYAVESRSDNATGEAKRRGHASYGGKLTEGDLHHLSLLCSSIDDESHPFTSPIKGSPQLISEDDPSSSASPTSVAPGWHSIDMDTLSALTFLLEEHVTSAMGVDLIGEARRAYEDVNGDLELIKEWQTFVQNEDCTGYIRLTTLRHGLEAASILLSIMTSAGIDRRIVSVTGITACLSLLRNHVLNNAIPAFSSLGHAASYFSKHDSNNPDAVVLSPPRKRRRDSQTKVTSSKKKKKNSASDKPDDQQQLIRLMKRIYPHILSTVGLVSLLMERIDLLIRRVPLDDEPLMSISSVCLSTLEIDPVAVGNANSGSQHTLTHVIQLTNVIQIASITLVSSIFQRYQYHRDIIMEDLVPTFLKVPTSKRSIRTYPVYVSTMSITQTNRTGDQVEQRPNIQMITALLLHLIQCCVTMPQVIEEVSPENKQSEKGRAGRKDKEDTTQITPTFQSGIDKCELACRTFVNEIVKRCTKKGDDGGASEYRPVLSNLVDDLLLVQTMPQFPSAELILFTLSMRLSNDLILNTSLARNKSGSNVMAEATYLKTAMDTLGQIYSDVAMKIVASRENPLDFPEAVDIEGNDHKDQFRCFCRRKNLVDTFMLDCDRCHGWFHGSCVGIPKDKLPEIWVCDECTMQMLVLEQAKALTNESGKGRLGHQDVFAKLGNEDEVYIMRILLLNYLDEKRLKSPGVENARHFQLARFIQQMEKFQKKEKETKHGSCLLRPELVCSHFLQMWNPNECIMSENNSTPAESLSCKYRTCEYLTEEGNSKLMLTLYATKSELAGSLPKLLEILLRLAADDTAILRKLALKALSQIVQVDPTIMSRPIILNNIIKRFQDEAISVREEAIALVGIHILNVPDHIKVFHKPLLGMLNDAGVSVRKRCVRIIRNILLMKDIQYDGRAYTCTALLARAANSKEDEGIRDLIHETFQLLWFENVGELLSPPTKYTSEQTERKVVSSSYEVAKQMVDVVATSQSPDYLAALLKEYLFGLGDMSKRKKCSTRIKPEEAKEYCSNIVASLIEQLIAYEEKISRNDNDDDKGHRLHAILQTLSVFADALPTLLLKDLETLFPLLKANNNASRENEALIVSTVCKIVSLVSNCLSEIDIRRLGSGDLPKDLVGITYKFGSDATTRAIEALSKLAFQSGQRKDEHLSNELLKLTKLFASCLIKHKDLASDFSKVKSSKVRDNIHRSLLAVGSVCRFYTKDCSTSSEPVLNTSTIIKHSDLTWDNLHSSMFNIFYQYLQNDDVAIKCEALGAMSGIFLSRPRILLKVEEEGMLREVLSKESNVKLQIKALECWRDILVAEEVRVDSGEAKRQMEAKEDITLSKRISGDQDGDASLIGACCTQHSSRLLEMLSSEVYAIRIKSLLLIEILLRQGLVNPMETVPHLLALQGDIDFPHIRSMALRMLIEEGQRRPDMIRQRLSAGMKRSYQFQSKVYSSRSKVTALIPAQANRNHSTECIFGQIFRNVIRGSRSHSLRVLSSLLSIFRDNNNDSSEESNVDKIPLLCYTAEMLAYLPYNHLGDILFIIYNISNILTLEANDYIMRFTEFVRAFGVEIDDDEDFIGKLSTVSKKAKKVFSVMFRNKSKFDGEQLQKFADLCAEASSFTLMLRLKSFLRDAYSGITEHRLREYLPNEKERIADRKVVMMDVPKFDSKIESSYKSNGSLDKDSLINQYVSFRQVLREHDGALSDDENDNSEVSNGKRKRVQTSDDDED